MTSLLAFLVGFLWWLVFAVIVIVIAEVLVLAIGWVIGKIFDADAPPIAAIAVKVIWAIAVVAILVDAIYVLTGHGAMLFH